MPQTEPEKPLPSQPRPDRPAPSQQAPRAADEILLAAMQQAGRQAIAATTPAQPPDDPEPSSPQALGHFVRLSDIAPEDIQWLSPGRLAAGKITVLDGDPNVGKSTLLCEFAARVTRGESLPGGLPTAPRGVILLSAEDGLHDTIRPRIDAAGGDTHHIIFLTTVPDRTPAGRPFALPGDASLLTAIAARTDAALIVVDPLVAFLGGRGANTTSHVRRALAALQSIAARTGAAIVIVRHLNKATAANPLYRGGGSIGIIGAARCGLVLARDPDDPERRILAATKSNLTHQPPSLAFRLAAVPGSAMPRVVWEGESRWSASQLLHAADERIAVRSALTDARAWLRTALADGPRPSKEILLAAAAHGHTERTLARARRAEEIVVRKEPTRHGRWIWALPPPPSKDCQPS